MTDTAHDSPTSLAEARDRIEGFGKHFDYDVGYLLLLADTAPAAFAAFDGAMALSAPRPALPPEVRAVAVFATLRADDCGACAQLNLRMAVEAGVPRPLLQTLLDEPEVLPAPLDDVYAHARQVAGGGEADPTRIERLRAARIIPAY